MKKRLALLAFATALLVAPAAYAQEPGQIGMTFGTPAGLGVIYHVNDLVAVRPDLSISANSGTFSLTTWTFGVSGLFYVARWDALRAYVSPRFAYEHLSSDATDGSSNYQFSGSFGAQYALHRRFSVFGEAGFSVAHTDLGAALSGTSTSSTGVSTRSSVGAIFYFN